jgi:uncharacterized membrane protein
MTSLPGGGVAAVALGLGIVAGLRSMTAPAVVSWAAHLGRLRLAGSPLGFLEHTATAYILGVLALGELIADKLPFTPSRKTPGPFAARIVLGGLSGAAVVAGTSGSALVGALLGGIGGTIGTLGGYGCRTGLVRALRIPDWCVALLEDVVAVGGGVLLVCSLASTP